VPLKVEVTPEDVFAGWLCARVDRARAIRPGRVNGSGGFLIEAAGQAEAVTPS
jgi:hypothetical protein